LKFLQRCFVSAVLLWASGFSPKLRIYRYSQNTSKVIFLFRYNNLAAFFYSATDSNSKVFDEL